jgi:acyl-CoA synthetase (AMP-forming)/AMP-acid ligase II
VTNLAVNLLRTAARFPDRPALRLGDDVMTYAALDDASARVVTYLRSCGVQPGDRVGLMLPNVPQFAVIYYGILRAGAVVVPMNPLLKGREVDFYLDDSEAAGIVAWHGSADPDAGATRPADRVSLVMEPSRFAEVLSTYEPTPGLVDREGPIKGMEMRVVDLDGNDVPVGEVGEIAIRGHNVMKGYWRRPDATAETIVDGWLRTGDLGRCDVDGYYTIVDGTKDMVIRGGYNVYPREVEEVLYGHPGCRRGRGAGYAAPDRRAPPARS